MSREASGEMLSDCKDCLRHAMRLTTRSRSVITGVSRPVGSAIDSGKDGRRTGGATDMSRSLGYQACVGQTGVIKINSPPPRPVIWLGSA